MEQQYVSNAYERGLEYDEGLRAFMLQVYNYMTFALAVSGMISLGIAMSPTAMETIWGSNLKWIFMFLPLVMSFALIGLISKMTAFAAKCFLTAFAAAMGASLSSIFAIFTSASIANVFFVSAATFGAASIYGYTTKKDLTKFGSFLIMGAMGLVIAGLVNLFLQSSAFAFAISCLGVLIFTGLTAYDTQEIKSHYDYTEGDERDKAGVIGALQLYLDFINIFISLLQLIGDRK